MKLSIETKVAAFVAAGFIALTAAAIGQGGSEFQNKEPNNYGSAGNAGGNTEISQQAYGSSSADERDVKVDRKTLSD